MPIDFLRMRLTTWRDRSGNKNHLKQENPANRPTVLYSGVLQSRDIRRVQLLVNVAFVLVVTVTVLIATALVGIRALKAENDRLRAICELGEAGFVEMVVEMAKRAR